jgi:hypothetical protein
MRHGDKVQYRIKYILKRGFFYFLLTSLLQKINSAIEVPIKVDPILYKLNTGRKQRNESLF